MQLKDYNRVKAVEYAHKWALKRNPAFYDYENLGGDCTNFASQCVYAGSGIMNFTPTFGWYYVNANRKAPAWTGVPYFYNFLTRKTLSREAPGPIGEPCSIKELLPGDIVQLSFDGSTFQHSPVVVSVARPVAPDSILLSAHTVDADNRPLSSYQYQKIRFIHIYGVVSA